MPAVFDNPALFADPNAPTSLPLPGTPGFPPLQFNRPAWPPLPQSLPSAAPTAPAIPPARAPIFPAAPAPATSPAPAPAAVSPTTASIGPSFPNPLTNHAATLMALGAGIAQGGIGRGLAMASSAAEAERNRSFQQTSLLQTYKALTDAGVPQQEAIAAVSNPSVMRTVATRYLGARAQANAAARPPIQQNPQAGSSGATPAPPSAADARRAPDGNYYVPDPNRPGKYLRMQ
jgi:hypothetical protein